MKFTRLLAGLLLLVGCSSDSKPPPQKAANDPKGSATYTIENDSGRWLQVDVYDQNNEPLGTLNLRFGDKRDLAANTHKVVIRVNGKGVELGKARTRIRINRNEDLEIVN